MTNKSKEQPAKKLIKLNYYKYIFLVWTYILVSFTVTIYLLYLVFQALTIFCL